MWWSLMNSYSELIYFRMPLLFDSSWEKIYGCSNYVCLFLSILHPVAFLKCNFDSFHRISYNTHKCQVANYGQLPYTVPVVYTRRVARFNEKCPALNRPRWHHTLNTTGKSPRENLATARTDGAFTECSSTRHVPNRTRHSSKSGQVKGHFKVNSGKLNE